MSDITMLQAQLQDAESTIKVWKAQALSSHENLMQSQDQLDAMKAQLDIATAWADMRWKEIETLRAALMMLTPEYFRYSKQAAAVQLIDAALWGEK